MGEKAYEVEKQGPPKLPLLPEVECIGLFKNTDAKFRIRLNPRKQSIRKSCQSTSVVPSHANTDFGAPLLLLEPQLANIKLLDGSQFLFNTPNSYPGRLLYGHHLLSSPADRIPSVHPLLPFLSDEKSAPSIPTLKLLMRKKVNE